MFFNRKISTHTLWSKGYKVISDQQLMIPLIRRVSRLYRNLNEKNHSLQNRLKRKAMPGSNIRRLLPDNRSQWYMCIDEAVDYLLNGQVVAIPTDTLYGLVTLAEFSDKLYRIKQRPDRKPLGLLVDQPEQIKKYCSQTVPDQLLKTLYPGPVTLLFQRSPELPSDFNPGIGSVGFRIPQGLVARDICRQLPFRLLAQTSANVSGADQNPICIEDFEELWDDIDLIIDGGPILENNGSRLGSTVVDLSLPGQYELLRTGCAAIETTKILREFGLKPAEEVETERLEDGKRGEMLEIEEIVEEKEEKQRGEESEEEEEKQKTRREMHRL